MVAMLVLSKDPRWKTAELESDRLAKLMGTLFDTISKLNTQATQAEDQGHLGRADGLRSKARSLKSKLDLAQHDYSEALYREEPLNKTASDPSLQDATSRGDSDGHADRRSSTRTAGQYNSVISALVQRIDEWEALSKDGGPVTKALDLLDKISKMVQEDSDFAAQATAPGATWTDKLNQFAPQQKIDDLKDVLHEGQRIAKNILLQYDNLNESFLRMGLR